MTLGEPEVLAFDVVGTPIGFETGMLGHLRGACGDAAGAADRRRDPHRLSSCACKAVLNAAPDGAASERFELHGPSACALALRVDDAARALSRAEEVLLCPAWHERVGADERRIPTVRAPDGTLVHLVETRGPGGVRTIWEDDFHLLPDAATAPDGGAPARLDAVDRLATDSFADRFVVEIAERRGGYRHYGAANAAVCLAAQARRPPRSSGAAGHGRFADTNTP